MENKYKETKIKQLKMNTFFRMHKSLVSWCIFSMCKVRPQYVNTVIPDFNDMSWKWLYAILLVLLILKLKTQMDFP